jgi:7-carboxy-7-deazaguanine synthase (Cx14CxxC type)
VSYRVKEIFYTLQGEGVHTGRPAVLCRFAGCNLWSGHETDRAGARCNFCDTDFVGGARYEDAATVAAAVASAWPGGGAPYVVCTGGEPLLQLDLALIDVLHARGFAIAVETNGSLPAPPGIDWLCVSPKPAPLSLTGGDELKLVVPQPGIDPADFDGMAFSHFLLQPMDGPERAQNTAYALSYCLAHPRWRLSLQTHKILGIR